MSVAPADWGAGLRINGIPVTEARADAGCTCVGEVAVVEHLLAALFVRGVSDAQITVSGGELPILDGSAAPYWIDEVERGPEIVRWQPASPIRVEAGMSWAEWRPGPLAVTVSVDFDDPGLPLGTLHTADLRSVLSAPTFVLARDVDRLRAAGRGRGASPENTMLINQRDQTPLVLAHKALDLLGDVATFGLVTGHFLVHRGSHRLHQSLGRSATAVQSRFSGPQIR